MFERFDIPARRLMGLARQEALRLKSEFIGTEHILLGILMQDGPSARVLKDLQIDLKRIRQGIEKLVTPSTAETEEFSQIPFSPRSKRAIELAAEEAQRLGHDVIGTEHLLIGLAMENQGTAAKVLTNLGVSLDTLRGKVLMAIKETPLPTNAQVAEAPWSSRTKLVQMKAALVAAMKKSHQVDPEHLLWAILSEQGPAAEFLDRKGIRKEDVEGLLDQPRG